MNKMRSQVKAPNMLVHALYQADHLVTARLDAALDANGLSIAKFGVLKELAEENEPLPLGQLAERLACVKSNITQLVDRLEVDGLVRRVPDSEDRRSTRAVITEEGRRRYEIGLKVQFELEEELLHGISPEEQEQLAMVIDKLSRQK
jgi:MarR family 2-MHQ and catechol resistance regulon transcriptional repressor